MRSAALLATAVLGWAGPCGGVSESGPPVRLTVVSGLDEFIAVPGENPLTPDRIDLGRRLFFDPRLSGDGSVACASCHRPDRAFSDSVPRSVGALGRRPPRTTPALINRAYGRSFSWDGAARDLEEQALRPIENPSEMALPLDGLERRLNADREYRRAFQRVFGRDPSAEDAASALAGYLRTIRSGNAPFDRFMAGDGSALVPDARAGFDLFIGRANCAACHLGPNFTDENFHNTGLASLSGDPGRFGVTGDLRDLGAFKTPTLREVEHTAPYMHDGSLATLRDVVDFYDRGGHPHPALDQEIRPLNLSPAETQALVAFLRSLSGNVIEGLP